jgi:TolB-like protein
MSGQGDVNALSAEKDREPISTVHSHAAMPAGAVFLSYASEDVNAAERIASALRAAGIEVWFDQSELRGGDAWDRQIREQIHHCRLFIPVISANSERRDEGYFRREWSLAVDRTRDMAHKRAFLVPVVIDGTPERGASVPEKFHELQWTRLPGGETPSAFVERIRRLQSPEAPARTAATSVFPASTAGQPSEVSVSRSWRSKRAFWAMGAMLGAALAYIAVDRLTVSRQLPLTSAAPAMQRAALAPADAAAFNPPPHSIAVLPFVNMSGDPGREYFSDGLSEELLNDLARINELQIAGRTSSFYFKGKDFDPATIGRRLNVGAILEGSVRQSGQNLRITAQLINTVTGFHLWSQSYDRNLGDVLKLQTEIANAVAGALKVALLGDVATKGKVGGTRNPEAFDAYLRALTRYWQQSRSAGDMEQVIAGYSEAVRLDPDFALAHAELSIAYTVYAVEYATGPPAGDWVRRAQAPAIKATALAPDLPEGHLALGLFLENSLDFARAGEEYERAMTLAPGDARVLRDFGSFAVEMGHTDAGLTALRRALALDPFNYQSHTFLMQALRLARRYDELLTVYEHAVSLWPDEFHVLWQGPGAYYGLGDFQKMRSLCEGRLRELDKGSAEGCLACAYHKLGRRADAEKALDKFKASWGDAGAYSYAAIYAQWGSVPKGLEWLESASRLRDPQLAQLRVDPALDPLRHESRFQAIERALKFPE